MKKIKLYMSTVMRRRNWVWQGRKKLKHQSTILEHTPLKKIPLIWKINLAIRIILIKLDIKAGDQRADTTSTLVSLVEIIPSVSNNTTSLS